MIYSLPSIKINGSSDIQIYNHKGLKTVSEKMIEIFSSIGVISIDGKQLVLNEITGDYISVSGKIKSVYYKE